MAEDKVTIIEGTGRETPARRLYRSTTNRSIAGVCAGLAEYLGIDAGIVRAIWLLSLVFTAGITLLLYILLAIVIPEEPADYAASKVVKTSDWWQRIRRNRPLLLGAILILAGALLLVNNLGLLPVRLEAIWHTVWALFWPLLLIGLGVALFFSLNGRGVDWSRMRQVGAGLPLRRSRQDRVIAGVCGGLAEYLHVDPVLVRLGWALLTIVTLGTVGILLYVLAVLFIPFAD
jgi:phage shock protein PspC (stress-responsive transcriptional regulator)